MTGRQIMFAGAHKAGKPRAYCSMLHEFLTDNRNELITACREKAAKRLQPAAISAAIEQSVPLFLRQLADTLGREQLTSAREDPESPESPPVVLESGRIAALHGSEMLRQGFTISDVVHGYGDVCQAVTALAVEKRAPISADEFRTLNRCLDDAIADAVTAFRDDNQIAIPDEAEAAQRRLSYFLEEQKRLVDVAIQAYSAIKIGTVGLNGATGTLLFYALEELRALGERAQSELHAPGTGSRERN